MLYFYFDDFKKKELVIWSQFEDVLETFEITDIVEKSDKDFRWSPHKWP